jgi:hypothetical protein
MTTASKIKIIYFVEESTALDEKKDFIILFFIYFF